MTRSVAPPAFLDRLDRLERENRRLRLAAAVCGLACFSWVACSLRPNQVTVSAERFVLTAPDGSEKATLELDDAGNPALILRNGSASAFLTTRGPSLLLRGADGKTGAFMGIDSKRTSRVELTSHRLLDGVRLTAQEDGSCGVYVLDSDGRQRAGLEAIGSGGTGLHFRDENGRLRGSMGLDPANVPNLILLDEAGSRRLGMLIQEGGHPLFEMDDDHGRSRIEITTLFDGSPLLATKREDGSESFRAP